MGIRFCSDRWNNAVSSLKLHQLGYALKGWWLKHLPPNCWQAIKRKMFSQKVINCKTASSRALKLCAKSNDVSLLSYKDLHEMAGRATPNRLAKYKLALQLYKTLSQKCPTNDWIIINLNITNTSRQKMFAVNKTNRLRVGYNAVSGRIFIYVTYFCLGELL